MFSDRGDAGKKLAQKLLSEKRLANLVIGLARGGVVIAKEISMVLGIPQDVLVVKKIGSPANPELAVGALAPDGIFYLNNRLAHETGAGETYIKDEISRQSSAIREKTLLYRSGKGPVVVNGKTVILTDDGAATGATMCAAIRWALRKGVKKIIIALPVAPPDVIDELQKVAHEVVVLTTIADFGAVGEFYKNFPQLTDEDVIKLLA